jgi:hypothetical protein
MPILAIVLALAVAGPLSFVETAVSSGVAKGGDPGAIAWLDADGDGDEDLFVAAIGRDRLFRNEGGGRFAKAKRVGFAGGSDASFGVAVADYDNDGRLDLFVANLGTSNRLYHNEGEGRFREVTPGAGVGGGLANSYSAAWADYDRDGLVDLYVSNGSQNAAAPNFLYHNEGGGRFREVAAEAGVAGNESSLGCAWGDYDNDGWPDLYVANFGQPNRLYRNRGDGTFADRAVAAGVDDRGNGAGAAWGDFDNDGDLDLYLFNTNSGASEDRLYRNEGDGTFADATAAAGLRESGDGEAVVWGDFDNDGWVDLFVVNRSDFSRQRNRLLRNAGGHFVDVTSLAGVAGTGSGQPAAAADCDGDGRLDLYVGNLPGAREELFLNRTDAGASLVVRLVGSESNRAAIGARVTVRAGDLTQIREIASSSGRSSQNQLAAHFGLGDATSASVEIRWPSGAVQTVEGVPPGTIEVVESGQGSEAVVSGQWPVVSEEAVVVRNHSALPLTTDH